MAEPFKQSNESYLHIENWQKHNPNLRAGFTTRNGGVSVAPFHSFNCGLHVNDRTETVIENRTLLASALNIPLENWVSGEQVHGTNVQIIVDSDKGRGATSYDSAIKGIDGLITNKKGILCTAFFADCVPLYFYDPVTEYIGIAHAGWKGTVNRIQEQMVQALTEVGVDAKNLLVAIGPSISQSEYEVDNRVITAISKEERQKTVIPLDNERYLLDLKQLNVEILLQSGVLRHNIEVTNYCTHQDETLFFSHRRDNGKTGRMLGFLGFQE
ncbi:peptidoglycan editing factor PgeF [Oceanobacillus chungangensis]|uniref:Purine nucleoside phosphorylase n=1 Tax=Oceanobacillus chungangensis TaxID=1229152 RepID=A0A3D8PP77_9BACI|nr:peptidoglycan editing factor PgeF [Oceanobacillus chungangensis]RDW17916.1 peptidoglycan editing factor PgeF [Oceanobacillus chungangensis]